MNAQGPVTTRSPLTPLRSQTSGAHRVQHDDLDTSWQPTSGPVLVLPTRGTLCVQTDRVEGVVVPGQAAFVPSGTSHRLVASEPVALQLLFLPDAEDDTVPLGVFAAPRLLRAAAEEAVSWDDSVDAGTRAALARTLAGLIPGWLNSTPDLTLPRASSPRLRRALTWLRIRLERPIGLADAARSGDMSERTLQRRCQAELGMSLSAWLTRARMLAALELLVDESLPIAEIALRCGYQSPAAFTRAFSGQVGCTPSTWRAAVRPG